MKKAYIQPAITLVKPDTESLLTIGSGEFSSTPSSETYDPNVALSKNHNNLESLWDESWDDEEDDE